MSTERPAHPAFNLLSRAAAAAVLGACIGCSDGGSPSPEPEAPAGVADSEPDAGLSPELNRIFAMIQEGRVDTARLRVQRHILENPEDGRALFLFGLTFHVQHRYEQARIHFHDALELAPNYPPLHYFYGWCLYNLGELDDAAAAFESHLQLAPGEPDTHFGLGLIALNTDRLDEARERFSRTIELYGDDAQQRTEIGRAHGKLGETYARMGGRGNQKLARQHLVIAAELYPDDHESLFHLYRVLLALGDHEAAEDARRRHEAARQRAGLPAPAAPAP